MDNFFKKIPKPMSNMQDYTNNFHYNQMPDGDKKKYLQYLYNNNYSVRDISKHVVIPESQVRSKIDAHRGRGPSPTPCPSEG
ncbi:hypothetical protein C1S86_25000 [Vibrio parahaemolyticus]|uniref:hypothetical protein n=1 Tax=Vibrio parahaemolyticus TaxID=670 RepID=UPI0009926C6C|nr:hypothetical protein [Vibrio parahaemolyticus]EHI9301213.1 hypothetical protein [Vibrio vulnificus]EHK9054210.1 hypothetical protein [Vibrio vulnificus]EHR7288473.1 hypothetical protein [Vibrio parahaemolyticus]ELP4435384.1 hypothetical protein [Vibrio vulnificus]MCU8221125.1 hypothetical protein [Vibrio vulnificus]